MIFVGVVNFAEKIVYHGKKIDICSCQNEDSDNYLVRIDLITECKDYSNDWRRIRAIFRIK